METNRAISLSLAIILIVSVTALSVQAYTLQIRVKLLEEAKETLETNLSFVNASVLQLQDSLSSLETATEINFDSMNSTIIALQLVLDTCVSDLENLESNIMDQETSILELQTRIDSLNASLTNLESLVAAISGAPSQHFKTIRFADPTERTLQTIGEYVDFVEFTWTPNDRTNNAILDGTFIFDFKYGGLPPPPSRVRASIYMHVNGKLWDGHIIYALEHWQIFQFSCLGGDNLPEPNRETHVINLRYHLLDDEPVALRNISIITTVIDGLPASN